MISFIIINYNQKKFLNECVQSILHYIKSIPFEIIIVNNSPGEELSEIEKLNRNILVISNENKGFSQANNTGVKFSNFDLLFFLNADTRLTIDFFIEMFKKIPDDFGAIGAGLIFPDRSFQLSSWKENTFFNEVKNKKDEEVFKMNKHDEVIRIKKNFSEIKEVDWISGAALIIRKNIFKKIDGFDERFFLFYEDADLCKKIKNAGLKIFYHPDADIIHHKGENVNDNFLTDTYYHSKESQFIYYKKHNPFFDNLFLRAYILVKFFILSIITFKRIYFRIFLLSIGIHTKK